MGFEHERQGDACRPHHRRERESASRRERPTEPESPPTEQRREHDRLPQVERQRASPDRLDRPEKEPVGETAAVVDAGGEHTAQHTSPVAFTEGTLTVQADSTAWAKQLQLMRSQILSEIVRRFPEAGVDAVRFIGPDVPSWKWGPRTIPGRGPRDTYG